MDRPVFEKLSDMMQQIITSMHEDQGTCTIFVYLLDKGSGAYYHADDTRKNLVSQLRNSEAALSELRIKVKTHYIRVNERIGKYDNIKEQYKRH